MSPSVKPRPGRVSLVALGAGLAAAGVGAAVGAAAERAAMGRPLLPGAGRSPNGAGAPSAAERDAEAERFGSLRGDPHEVRADDGTALHVEVDEPTGRGRRRSRLTIVFTHGYAHTMDAWHYQRREFRGRHRLVFWDQRGHGRSAAGPAGSATIDQVGRDLAAVIDAVADEGPLVLIGHSMGGMTVMSLAQHHPELFAQRVIGVALLSTSAGGLGEVNFGMPRLGRVIQAVAPPAVRALARSGQVIERGRRMGSDLEAVLVRRYSYASPVPPELVRFTAEMIAATRMDTISEFLPTFGAHDKRDALAAMTGMEILVLVGDGDLLTPVSHSLEIVHHLPGAEHVVVPQAGHLVMLEHPDVVSSHLWALVNRALRVQGGAA